MKTVFNKEIKTTSSEEREWTFKKILIRLIAYPFCVIIIISGFYMIKEPVTRRSIPAGFGAIVAGSIYLLSDIGILISKKIKQRRKNR